MDNVSDQLRFVSHLYNDAGSTTPREVQDMAKVDNAV